MTTHTAQIPGLVNLLLGGYWKGALLVLHDNRQLNDEKTEFLIMGTPQHLEKVVITHIRVGNTNIYPVSVARNLGSWFDSKLTMTKHITKICCSSF